MAFSFFGLGRLFQSFTEDDKRLADSIQAITGTRPKNLELYKLAVRHSSVVQAAGPRPEHNERLEYLGDAVLGTIVAHYLFQRYPFKNEGFLTEIRARMVNGDALNDLALKIGLDKLVRYEGRRKQQHTHRSMYGDAMEALVGAYYLDFGFDPCKKFVTERLLKPHYDLDQIVESETNHKSRLIEWSQKNGYKISFDIIKEAGRSHTREFTAQVTLEGLNLATGTGFSKKKAEQNAALKAYDRVNEGRLPDALKRKPNMAPIQRLDAAEGGSAPSVRPDNRPGREDRAADREYRRDRQDQHPRGERHERGDRGDRSERHERGDRQDRESRSERMERSDRPERQERTSDRRFNNSEYEEFLPESTGDESRPRRQEDRPERGDRPERSERGERGDRPERQNQPRQERQSRPERDQQQGQPRRHGRYSVSNQEQSRQHEEVQNEAEFSEAGPLEALEPQVETPSAETTQEVGQPRQERQPREPREKKPGNRNERGRRGPRKDEVMTSEQPMNFPASESTEEGQPVTEAPFRSDDADIVPQPQSASVQETPVEPQASEPEAELPQVYQSLPPLPTPKRKWVNVGKPEGKGDTLPAPAEKQVQAESPALDQWDAEFAKVAPTGSGPVAPASSTDESTSAPTDTTDGKDTDWVNDAAADFRNDVLKAEEDFKAAEDGLSLKPDQPDEEQGNDANAQR